MAITDVLDLPNIIIERYELGIYLPPVNFGYLYIITAENTFIYVSIVLASISTYAFLDLRYYTEFEPLEARTDIPVFSPLLEIITLVFVVILCISFPASVWFVLEHLSPKPDAIRTVEVVSVSLLLIDIVYISTFVFGVVFYRGLLDSLDI